MRASLMRILLPLLLASASGLTMSAQQDASRQTISILYLEQLQPTRSLLSNVLPDPRDLGLAGAQLAVTENNTSGKFIGKHYTLTHYSSEDADKLIATARKWIAENQGLVLADLPTASLLQLNQGLSNTPHILFNVSNSDDSLRTANCAPHLLHTAPSRAMLSDGLVQFLIAKQWRNWLLIIGQQTEDERFADAIKRSSKRFGGNIIAQRQWTFDTDLRRSAQREVSSFTSARDYDVTLVADESGDFGEFIPYNTRLPRPVAGTQGLKTTAWHWSIEQWGAAQLQNRFRERFSRNMASRDYSAWLAVRALGESITRGANTTTEIYTGLLSEDFKLAGFMGRGLSFRSWNGQLRQPIPLVQPHALVSLSPQEGFLHPVNDLDTLGYDRPEVNCLFTEKVALQ